MGITDPVPTFYFGIISLFLMRISKVITKSGDDGQTGLGDGRRVSKTHNRIQAIGSIDHLNSLLGWAMVKAGRLVKNDLERVQQDLFDLGGELAMPGIELQLLNAERLQWLEHETEKLNKSLAPLEEFILPGGTELSARIHIVRTACRNTERDIVALAGLKYTITGHTLADEDKPVLLEPMEFPDPVLEIAVEPKTNADQEKMGEALGRLAREDPSFRVSSDEESGQTIIKGMGELHLDIIVDRMKREFKVEANIGAPQVAYRETILSNAEFDYIHKKQSGGAGQFARVKLAIEPLESGKGREVENKIKGGSIPKEFIPGVEKGIESVSDSGILAGFPIIDYKVTIVDGLHHDVDSSVLAFEIASRHCFKEVCTKASLKLLEPIMRVEVVTPEDYMGDVIGDLNSRRGHVEGTESRGNVTVITAMAPLANMFGYVNNLRSMSQGRAQYSMFFDHYEKVPQNVQEEVTKKMA